jgi:hypothetical protein
VPAPLTAAPISDGRLQALLTPFAVTMLGIFLYYSGRRQVLPKLRAFIDHVKSRSNVANKTRIQVDDRRASPLGVETDADIAWRKDLLRKIGYKL